MKESENSQLLSNWLQDNKLQSCEIFNAKLTTRSCAAIKEANKEKINKSSDIMHEKYILCTDHCSGLSN